METTNSKYSSKKYLTVFILSTLFLLLCIGLVNYLVDPFFQFRADPNSRYFLNPRLVNGGLAKNYDYNTVVLGSSMVQNYNLSILREKDASSKPLKLSTGGMNCVEMEYLYSFIDKKKAKRLIINLDLPQFNNSYEAVRYPEYLYEDGLLNKLEYLYGYETNIRFTPIDIGLSMYLKGEKEISPKYKMKVLIDEIGNNSLEATYNAEHVKDLYRSGMTVSPQKLEDIKSRMENRLDSMLSRMQVDKHKDIKYTFVLPPYSALYWYHTQKSEYRQHFIDFVHYLSKTMEKYDNVTVQCFFDIDEITDLNNYTDITHFSPKLSDKILRDIDDPAYTLNSSTIDGTIQKLDSLVTVFHENNKDWLSK